MRFYFCKNTLSEHSSVLKNFPGDVTGGLYQGLLRNTGLTFTTLLRRENSIGPFNYKEENWNEKVKEAIFLRD